MFPKIFENQFKAISTGELTTRSSKILLELHGAVGKVVESNSQLNAICIPKKEYCYDGIYTSKKIDVALMQNGEIKGIILVKAIRSEYLKNANNYFENMIGESLNLLLTDIPVFQILLLPQTIHLGGKRNGLDEELKIHHLEKYEKLLAHPIHKNFKMGVWVFDIDYDNYVNSTYSNMRIKGMEDTVEEGIINFIGGISCE